jgi:GH15 family glucan-1,4-alpha-glucosidase
LGFFDVILENFQTSTQEYIKNTPILRTVLSSKHNEVEIIDFSPRFKSYARTYHPAMLIRIINPLRGRPRARIRLRPTFGYGWGTPEKTRGSNHIRYMLPQLTLRLTTNAPVAYLLDEVLFEIDEPIYLVIMPDESLSTSLVEMVLSHLENTKTYWQDWVRGLTIPFEYQKEVIRSAITVKVLTFEETGSVLVAATTSIPPFKGGPRNDQRYTWLRWGPTISNVFIQLGATGDREAMNRFYANIVANAMSEGQHLQPVYGIALETRIHPRDMHRLAGYRNHAPVVVGTADYARAENGAWGAVIMTLTQAFFDERLQIPGDELLFRRLEELGREAYRNYQKPDAGVHLPKKESEYAVHTISVFACWAACDRLAKIATKLGLASAAQMWESNAGEIKAWLLEKCYNVEAGTFVEHVGMTLPDAHVLLLARLGFLNAHDPRFLSTVNAVETHLKKDGLLLRTATDKNVSFLATLWYVSALAAIGRTEDARTTFKALLARGTPLGFFSETVDTSTGELWGNFPHIPTMATLIHTAFDLSMDWSAGV